MSVLVDAVGVEGVRARSESRRRMLLLAFPCWRSWRRISCIGLLCARSRPLVFLGPRGWITSAGGRCGMQWCDVCTESRLSRAGRRLREGRFELASGGPRRWTDCAVLVGVCWRTLEVVESRLGGSSEVLARSFHDVRVIWRTKSAHRWTAKADKEERLFQCLRGDVDTETSRSGRCADPSR